MTEKKAQEKLNAYLQAEVAGRNEEAAALEQELNDAGWFITSGPDGMTLKKDGKEIDLPNVEDYLIPKEGSAPPTPGDSSSNRTLWIALGITASVILVTVVVIIIIKRKQNAQLAGLPKRG